LAFGTRNCSAVVTAVICYSLFLFLARSLNRSVGSDRLLRFVGFCRGLLTFRNSFFLDRGFLDRGFFLGTDVLSVLAFCRTFFLGFDLGFLFRFGHSLTQFIRLRIAVLVGTLVRWSPHLERFTGVSLPVVGKVTVTDGVEERLRSLRENLKVVHG
jgi:hypothetical protein